MGTVVTAAAVAVAVVLLGISQAVQEALAALVDMVVEAVMVETDASSSTIKAVMKC
jgi:methionine synthase I (cobalamin-dependent)